jgi:tRNA (guanine37-N1)-methyltransferase
VIYLTPDGEKLSQRAVNALSLKQNLILLCGHYKGVDERVREHFITREISIGDYVLSGGELAAAVVADAVIRLVPGVLSDETSALTDSFQGRPARPPGIYAAGRLRRDESAGRSCFRVTKPTSTSGGMSRR